MGEYWIAPDIAERLVADRDCGEELIVWYLWAACRLLFGSDHLVGVGLQVAAEWLIAGAREELESAK